MISDSLTVKILVLGDSNVGKSSFINYLKEGKFKDDIQATLGIERITIKTKIKDENYDINIWDTAGQERFRGVSQISCKYTDCAIICFNMNDQNSFNNVPYWIQMVNDYCPTHTQIVVVGTKCDLEQKYSNLIELERTLQFYNCKNEIQVTSATTGSGMKEAFQYACQLGADAKYKDRDPSVLGSFVLGSKLTTQKSLLQKSKQGCC